MNLTMYDITHELLVYVSKRVLNQLRRNADINLIDFKDLYASRINIINTSTGELTIYFKGNIETKYLIGTQIYDNEYHSALTLEMDQEVDCVLNVGLDLKDGLIYSNLNDFKIESIRTNHSEVYKTHDSSNILLSKDAFNLIEKRYTSKVRDKSERDFRFTEQSHLLSEVIAYE